MQRKRKPETKEVNYTCKHCGKCCVKLLYKSSKATGHSAKFCNQECMVLFMKANAFTFSCLICKKDVQVTPSQHKLRNRKTCSRQCLAVHRRNLAIERRKTYTKHQLDRLERYSPEVEVWRKSVFERDDYTCQFCGVRGTYLEADHIKPWAYFPELRYELSNGRTLCRPCHDTTKISAKAMRSLYGKKDNKTTQKETVGGV